jgi:hypothetical protein
LTKAHGGGEYKIDTMNTKYIAIIKTGDKLERQEFNIPDTWKRKARDWLTCFHGVSEDRLIVFAPEDKLEEIISLLSAKTAS